MKQPYLNPEMEMVFFSALDIITTSTAETTSMWVPRENEGLPGRDGCCIWDW